MYSSTILGSTVQVSVNGGFSTEEGVIKLRGGKGEDPIKLQRRVFIRKPQSTQLFATLNQ